jgi:Mrp family chromosome partitioning ATPase
LLSLQHINVLCESLEQNAGVDIIIFDTPPVMAVIDTMTLASNIGAAILLVIESGRTRRDNAIRVLEEANQIGANIVGVVLNRVTSVSSSYYYYYYNYGRYSKNGKK